MVSTNRLATVVIVPRTLPHFSLIITAGDGARNVRRDEFERKRLLAAAGRVNRRAPFLQTT
jgi:ribosomal protein L39E